MSVVISVLLPILSAAAVSGNLVPPPPVGPNPAPAPIPPPCSLGHLKVESPPSFGHSFKPLFALRSNYTNLNHGSYGSVPRAVTKVRRCIESHVEASPDMWYRFEMYGVMEFVRGRLASYINAASKNDVVFVDNASNGINAVLRSLAPDLQKSGGKILFLSTAYTMVVNTLKFVEGAYSEQLLRVNVSFTPRTQQEFDEKLLRDVEDALKAAGPHGSVALASFSHIVSLPAVILPVKKLTALCHLYGTRVVIDGAHAMGQIKVDVQDINADFYVANGHKWLYSPKGSAILWVNPTQQQFIVPTTISYEGKGPTPFVTGFSYQGTQDMSQFVSMSAALDWREMFSDEKIIDYMHDLAMTGAQILVKAWGTEQLGDNGLTGAMCNVRLPTVKNVTKAASLTPQLLDKYGTYVPIWRMTLSGKDHYYVRVSAQIYNDKSDFENLAKWVLELLQT